MYKNREILHYPRTRFASSNRRPNLTPVLKAEPEWPPQHHKNSSQNIQSLFEYAYMCVKDYCDNTSLHGFKYITQHSKLKCERFLWVLLCSCTIIGTVIYMHPFMEKFLSTPISTTIASTGEPVWTIPFPGVTICNVNKATKSQIQIMSNTSFWKKYPPEVINDVIRYVAKIGHVQANRASTTIPEDLLESAIDEQVQGEGLSHLMEQVTQPIERMALKCWWISRAFNCSEMLQLRHTDTGFCWGFNTVAMTLANGIEDVFTPVRVNGAGHNVGLTVLLNPDVEQYYAYSNNVYGFKVRIHYPMDFPNVASKSFLVDSGKEVHVAVTPIFTQSTKNIRNTARANRHCRFEDEHNLDYFPTYSAVNCRLECLLFTMRTACGCVPYMFSMLKNQTRCRYRGLKCINELLSKVLTETEGDKDARKCDCPPGCISFGYSYEQSQASFPMFPDDLKLPGPDYNKSHLVLLRVFFKDETYVQFERDVMYTANDFVASFGGIVGLFIGFSFISVAELIYFLAIKPFLHWNRFMTRNKVTTINVR